MIHTRTKIIAVFAFCLFVASIAFYAVFFSIVSGHKEKLAEERLRVAEAESERNALSTLEAIVIASKTDREQLTSYVLKDEEIIELLSLIEATAREQGVHIATDSLTVEPRDDVFESLNLTFSIDGSFDGIMRMIRILEVLPQQSRITRVILNTFEENEVTKWHGTVDLRVTKFKKI